MRFNSPTFALSLIVLGAALWGCREQAFQDPPIHLNPNMDQQQRFEAQEKNTFFSNNMAMRPEVPATVAVGELKEDDHLYRGLVNGQPARILPMPLTSEGLSRGRERYDIYCAPCHDKAGTGEGMVVKRGMTPPPSFHDDRLRSMPVGQMFQVMTTGVRNMPSYAMQIPAEDRWAIVAYLRALQRSHAADLSVVPEDIARSRGWAR